jgi:hypothetical protein
MVEDSLPLSIFIALNSGVSRWIPYCSRAELITSERIQHLQEKVPRPKGRRVKIYGGTAISK